MQENRRSGGDRRKGSPLNKRSPPYLTKEGLILTDRRVVPDRRQPSPGSPPH
jgi:hypothetical protein